MFLPISKLWSIIKFLDRNQNFAQKSQTTASPNNFKILAGVRHRICLVDTVEYAKWISRFVK